MVDDLLADLLGHVRDVIVVLFSNPIQEIEGVVLAQVPVELGRRAQADKDSENRDDDLALRFVAWLIALRETRKHAAFVLCLLRIVVRLRAVLGVYAAEIVVDGNLSQLDQAGDALPVQNGAMELDELGTVLDDLDNLLDLLEAASILVLNVRDEELEEVLAHLVVDDGLARNLLLLDGQIVQNAQTEAQREPDAADLVELVVLVLEEEGSAMTRLSWKQRWLWWKATGVGARARW